MARGDGTTTRQMQAAPCGALFIWVNDRLSYPRDLARKIGREDLRIEPPSFFDSDRWIGLEFSGVVIDHATHLSARQLKVYFEGVLPRVRSTSTRSDRG